MINIRLTNQKVLPTSKTNGQINNIIGYCRLYGMSEIHIKNIKTHNFNELLLCNICNMNANKIRDVLLNRVECVNYQYEDVFEEILSCDEMIVKNILE